MFDMRIGLVDVDGHGGYPNYALCKISAYHKAQGDSVEFANPLFGEYDKVYMSKVFTFTPDNTDVWNCEVVKGGTGYDHTTKLPNEIDRLQPDYSLYGIKGVSYGFLTRGCNRKCDWCIVPKKEGAISPYMDIDEIANGNNKIILMDNNILASDYGLLQIEKIAERGYAIDFNQGLDARLITDDIARLLARCKWLRYIRVACDQSGQIKHVENALRLLRKHGYKKELFVYCLLKDFQESYERVKALYLHKDDITLHCQAYRNFDDVHQVIPQWQKDMMRWSNKRWIYQSDWFDDYMPRKGFKCSEYRKTLF